MLLVCSKIPTEMTTIKVGVLEVAMSGQVAETYHEARRFLGKTLNVSEEFEMLDMTDIFSYNGTGTIGKECNVVMFPLSFTSIIHQSRYMFTTVISEADSVIVSGPPEKMLKVSTSRMVPVEINVFLTLAVATLLVWSINKLVSKVIPSKVRTRLRNNAKWFQLLTDLLILNCPLISHAIPGLNGLRRGSRILFSFWLVSQTLILWNVCSYFSADASTIVYSRIDDLADLNEHEDAKLKLLLDSTEHRFLNIQAERNSARYNHLAKMMKDDASYLPEIDEILADELYVEISEKNTVLVVNSQDLRYASCVPLSFAERGKFTLYFSSRSFLQTPQFFLLDRNLSSSVNEIINGKLGRIYEARTFDNVGLECKYVVYSKHVWVKPVDNEVRLNIWAFYYPVLLLILSFTCASVISLSQVLFSLLR